MSRLGVYVAAYSNPVFLRHTLLQILHQSRRPDTLAVHENGYYKSYRWAVEDVIQELRFEGVDVHYLHTSATMAMPTFFIPPLQTLLNERCDYYAKLDQDDLVYQNHFEQQEALLFNPQLQQPDFDYAMNRNAGLLVLLNQGGYKYNAKVDFGLWNPTGAHPSAIIFNRAVAEEFVKVLSDPQYVGLNDDRLLADGVLPKFKGHKYDLAPTMCYVAHNKTASTAHWAAEPPSEVS